MAAARLNDNPPSRTRRTASVRTSGGYGGGTLPDMTDSFLPDETWSRQAVRCPRIPGHSKAGSAHDKQILDAIDILLEAAPVAAKNNDEIKHKERMKQIERFYRWVPFVKSTIALVAAGFLIEIVGVVFFNGQRPLFWSFSAAVLTPAASPPDPGRGTRCGNVARHRPC